VARAATSAVRLIRWARSASLACCLGACPALGLAQATAAPARKPEPTRTANARASLEALLRKSSTPPSATDLAGVGRNVDELLVSIARDAALDLPLRARAVGALARVPTAASRGFLMAMLEDPEDALAPAAARRPAGKPAPDAAPAGDDVTRTLLRRAAVSLGWIGGSLAPAALGPLLAHTDPDVRADAAVALALTRLPEAARLLRARLPIEPDPRVRGHLARQLNVVEGALGPATPPPGPPPKAGLPQRGEF
jgi:HEAT repeat protein